jgi:chromosome segregation ATPase
MAQVRIEGPQLMEDTDFFDTLYQGWTKTTGAENTFWMPEEYTEIRDTPEGGEEEVKLWAVVGVAQDQSRTDIANAMSEDDAAWITALHGCFADLIRRLHMAVDEAERFSVQRDEQEGRIAEVALELQNTQETLMHTTDALSMIKGESRRQLDKIGDLESYISYINDSHKTLSEDLRSVESYISCINDSRKTLSEGLRSAEDKIESLEETMRRMDQDLIKANADLVYWKDIAEGIQR